MNMQICTEWTNNACVVAMCECVRIINKIGGLYECARVKRVFVTIYYRAAVGMVMRSCINLVLQTNG